MQKNLVFVAIISLVVGLLGGIGLYSLITAGSAKQSLSSCASFDQSHLPCILDQDYFDKIASQSARTFTDSRDNMRRSNITSILEAIGQYMSDHDKRFDCPKGVAVPHTPVFIGSGVGEYNIASCLVPAYISTLPLDPAKDYNTSISANSTGYRIMFDAVGRVTVDAPYAEVDKPISITR